MPETAADRYLSTAFGGDPSGIKLGSDFRNLVLDELLRSVGSLQAQNLNRISPDLPLATQLSLQRGIAQSGAESVQRGVTGLEKFIAGSNRDALLRLLGYKQGEEIAKIQKKGDLAGQLLSQLGQGAEAIGYIYGGGAGG